MHTLARLSFRELLVRLFVRAPPDRGQPSRACRSAPSRELDSVLGGRELRCCWPVQVVLAGESESDPKPNSTGKRQGQPKGEDDAYALSRRIGYERLSRG